MGKFDLEDLDLHSILSAMHEGVVIADVNGIIRFFNDTQAGIDDIDPEYAVGRKITEIYQLSGKTSAVMRCIGTGRPVPDETMVYRTRLGRVANTINHAYPLYMKGRLVGAINFSKNYQLLEKTIFQEEKHLSQKKSSKGSYFCFNDITGSDPALCRAVKIANLASVSPSSVMIYGESGTGKEMFAQSIHTRSSRRTKPFIPVNCAAIPENLLEGILFGTSKGAFTGAVEKRGLFEQACGGTIFLDELDSMPLGLQAKLLRVIQEKKVRKLGALRETDLNIKIISSVGRHPEKIIKNGLLRTDLFYRMGVVFIMLPPLRKRKSDIDELTRYFIDELNIALNRNVTGISSDVRMLFAHYDWPGNVRELKHVIEAAMNVIEDGRIIKKEHLPFHIFHFTENDEPGSGGADMTLAGLMADHEKQILRLALEKYRGNAARAARSLGVSPQSLHYKLKKYKISPKFFTGRTGKF